MSQKKTPQTKWFITTRLVRDIRTGLVEEREGYWYSGPLSLAHEAVNCGVEGVRFYDTGGTPIAAQDTDPVTLDVDTDYWMVVRFKNTSNDSSFNNGAFQVQYNNTTQASGALNVTTTTADVYAVAATLTNDATYGTDFLTGGTETREGGHDCTDGISATITLGVNTYCEVRYGIRLSAADVAHNDNIDITFLDTATALDFDNIAVSITVNEVTLNQNTYAPTGGITLAGAATTADQSLYVYDVSGGITLAGAATTSVASGSTDYVYTVSGGITLGGAAVTDEEDTYTYAVSGGLTAAGAATYSQQWFYTYAVSGGITLGGAAVTDEQDTYIYAPSGGVSTGGAATYSEQWFYTYTVSGGLQTGGVADLLTGKIYPVSGGITIAGEGVYSQLNEATYVASGGLTGGGASPIEVGKIYPVSGGLQTGGAAQTGQVFEYIYAAAGGITTAGAATTAREAFYTYAPSGGIATGGTSTHEVSNVYTGVGGLLAAGVAAVSIGVSIIASGGMSFGGSAATDRFTEYVYAPSGGIAAAGAANTSAQSLYTYAVSGGLQTGGVATTLTGQGAATWIYAPTGGIATSGAAANLIGKVFLPSGGIATSGAASTAASDRLTDVELSVAELEATMAAIEGKVDDILTKLTEIWKLDGLDISNPMVVSDNNRSVDTISQTINETATNTTVTRTS